MLAFCVSLAFFVQGFDHTFSASTRNRLLTFFSANRVSWNHAVELCESQAASLVTIDNEDSYEFITLTSVSSWSSNWDDFWTGLHYVPSQFLWQSSCTELGSYRPWFSNLSYEERPCVIADSGLPDGAFLRTNPCYMPRGKALCERVDGACSFEHNLGKTVRPGDFVSTVVEANDSEECKTACLNYLGSVECWAAEYKNDGFGTMICSLHHDISSTALKTRIESDPGNPMGITYRKICFSASVDANSHSLKYTETTSDDKPWKGCTSAATEATTTSQPVSDASSGVTTSSGPTSIGTTRGLTPGIDSTSISGSTSSGTTSAVTTSSATSMGGAHNTHSITEVTTSSQKNSTVTSSSTTNTDDRSSGITTSSDATTANGEISQGITTSSTFSSGTTTGSIPSTNSASRSTSATRDATSSFLLPVSASSTGNSTVCCACHQGAHLTDQQKRAAMAEILASLSMNTAQVLAWQRRRISTWDSRLSAMTLGYLGVFMMVLFFAGIIAVDISYVVRDVQYFIFNREVAIDPAVKVQRSRRIVSKR